MFRNWPLALALMLCTTSARAQGQLGDPFDLGVGESVLITDAGFRVGFDWIAADSRCPLGVVCIWEGSAAARVWAETLPWDRENFELNSNPRLNSETTYRGFVIKLLEVEPYPAEGTIIDPNTYVVTVVVDNPVPVSLQHTTWGAIKALFR